MFRDDTTPTPRTKLYVIRGGRHGFKATDQGEKTMNAYKFAEYRGNSTVASGVTLLVSMWFLLAAGAILSDPAPAYSQRALAAAAPTVQAAEAPAIAVPAALAIAPEARLTITVEASRSATL
jgi:hypothetical protein